MRHLGRDKTECPPLPPTGGDGKPAQLARAHRTVLPAALLGPRPHSGPAHGSRGAVGAVRHFGWDKTECPPLPPTGGDGTPAQLARAHRTVLPAALIRPRPQSARGPAHGSRGAVGAVRHLGWDETECPPLPPTGGDGTPAQLARAHRTVPPEAADCHANPLATGTPLGVRNSCVASERLIKTVQLQWGRRA